MKSYWRVWQSLKYNPNDYMHILEGGKYESYLGDCIQVIDNISKLAEEIRGKTCLAIWMF